MEEINQRNPLGPIHQRLNQLASNSPSLPKQIKGQHINMTTL